MGSDKSEKPAGQASFRASTKNEGKSVSAFDRATDSDFAAYIFDQTKVFLRSAQERELDFLSYLLEMVAVEAARLRDERQH